MYLDKNNRSVFLLNYHLVLVIDNERRIDNKKLSNRLQDIFEDICKNYNINLLNWDFKDNYINIIFKSHPNSEISKFINAYKSSSSRLIKKEFPEVNNETKSNFWVKSFLLLTIGSITKEEISNYVKKIKK